MIRAPHYRSISFFSFTLSRVAITQATFLPWGFTHPLPPLQQSYQHANDDGKRNSSAFKFPLRVQNLDQGGVVAGLDLFTFPARYIRGVRTRAPLPYYIMLLCCLTFPFSFTSLFFSRFQRAAVVQSTLPSLLILQLLLLRNYHDVRAPCHPPFNSDSASQYWMSVFPPLSFLPSAPYEIDLVFSNVYS